MTNEAPKSQPDFKKILLAKHGEDDTICVSMLKNSGVEQRFVGGVEAAARMIERNYEREDIQAFWTNLQTLRKGADARRKEQIEKYTNLTVDIDRKWKWIHEDGAFCKHTSKERKDLACGGYKCNATDEERTVLYEIAEKVVKFLAEFGPASFTDSGNGYHLNWKLDNIPPVDGQRYYEGLLNLLKAKFEAPDLNVDIDSSLADFTQVTTVPFTWNRKYSDTMDRPQRQSKLLFMPSSQRVLKFYDLELFLDENKIEGESSVRKTTLTSDDAYLMADPEWLENYGIPHLIEHFEKLGYWEQEGESFDAGNNHCYPVTPCYCHEDEPLGHIHSHANDCCLVERGDGGVGISCFSRSFGLKTVIKRLNDRAVADGHAKYPHLVFEGAEPKLSNEEIAAENAEAMKALSVEIVRLEPEYRFRYAYEGSRGRIYSNDGVHWVDKNENSL